MADTISRIAKYLPQIEPRAAEELRRPAQSGCERISQFPGRSSASGAQPTKSLFLNRDFATGIVWWHHLPWAFKFGIMLSIEEVRMAHRKACTRA